MNIGAIKKQIQDKATSLAIPQNRLEVLFSNINSIDEANQIKDHIHNNSSQFSEKIEAIISILKNKRAVEYKQGEDVLSRIRTAFLN